jgi:hypothetical protein
MIIEAAFDTVEKFQTRFDTQGFAAGSQQLAAFASPFHSAGAPRFSCGVSSGLEGGP